MSFFADSPSLLGETQTFVASIAALIVLCLFRDKNNFLFSMISSLNEVLYKEAISKSDGLKKQEQEGMIDPPKHRGRPSSEEQAWLKAIMKLKLELNRFVTKVNTLLKNYEDFKHNQELRDEPRYMSIFMFIEVIAMLTFDSLNISAEAGAMLLWSVNWFTAVFSVVLWMHYWNEFTKYYIRPRGGYWYKATYAMMVVLCILIISTLMWLQGLQMAIILTIATLLLVILIHDGIAYFQMKGRLNDKFVVKYGLGLLVLSLVTFLCYSLAYYQTWLVDSVSSNKAYLLLAQWSMNVEWFTSTVRWARSVFVLLLVINAFIAPLCLAYLQNRKKFNQINRDIDDAYTDSHVMIEEYKKTVAQAKANYDARYCN